MTRRSIQAQQAAVHSMKRMHLEQSFEFDLGDIGTGDEIPAWTQEEIDRLDAVLSKYYPASAPKEKE